MESGEPDTRLRNLQAVTDAALAHLEFEKLVDVLLTRVRDILGADTAAVLLIDEDGKDLVARGAKGLEEEVERGTRIPLGRGFAGRIAANGQPLALDDVEHADVVNPLLREKGIKSMLGVPLTVEGEVTGVLHVGSLVERVFDEEETELLQLVGDRIALALEHARLYEAERSARVAAEFALERVRQIGSITEVALAHLALDDHLLAELLERVRGVLEADTTAILLLDPEADELVARAARGLEEEVERGVRIPVGGGFAGRIAALAAPVIIDDVDHAEVLNPLLREKGVKSLLGVPLLVDGSVIGVLHVGTLVPRDFTEDDTSLLQLAADRIAIAIHHARMYEREHLVAETLQRSLLPDVLPDVPGIEIAARYVPGATEADVGGDWYDVLPLPGGTLALIIGDVVSRGVRAAAVMGQLRNALRAYALDGHPPGMVLERIDRLVRSLEKREMATLLYVELSPHELTLRYASAGHPPPIVVAPDGHVDLLEEGRSSPLGVRPDARYAEATAQLEPGSTLVLYTDGLVERRDMWIDEGIGNLVDEARSAHPATAEALCDRLLGSLLPAGGAADDVAVLAVQFAENTGRRLELALPAEPTALVPLRRTMRSWLGSLGSDEDTTYDILVAVTEAAANAVEHAYGPAEARFEVAAEAGDEEVLVTITDFGQWREPRGRNRGRGTMLMRELMDTVVVSSTEAGTEVRMTRRLGRVAV